ncbi:MAG TPA: sortase [Anaerolineae bacterium]|nr:sortase [Anaerolineae bacterium]HMR67020.1 sortase [Anaerolineae bacterium]
MLSLPGCGGLIAIVPAQTPTPPPPPPPATATSQVEASFPGSPPRRIVSPAIELDAPVVEMGWRVVARDEQLVSEWNMPEQEAAWHKNSAWPGQGSNVVISGHNASAGGQVFARLDDLQLGDEITLWTDLDQSQPYQVIEKNVVRTFAMSAEAKEYLLTITQPTDHEQLTLITCWPSWSNTHRLIVIAQPKAPPN